MHLLFDRCRFVVGGAYGMVVPRCGLRGLWPNLVIGAFCASFASELAQGRPRRSSVSRRIPPAALFGYLLIGFARRLAVRRQSWGAKPRRRSARPKRHDASQPRLVSSKSSVRRDHWAGFSPCSRRHMRNCARRKRRKQRPLRSSAGPPGRRCQQRSKEARRRLRRPRSPMFPVALGGQAARIHLRKMRTPGAKALRAAVVGPGMPAIPGRISGPRWARAIVARGQPANRAAISGRTSGIAVAPGGMRVYAATANGGVWRSDDARLSWRSTMDGFDVNSTSFASAGLACGAIAIDPAAPDRVYVGTGEGDTDALFASRITNALPSYRGIGPIRSDDGGLTWQTEPSSPSLAGFAFFQDRGRSD